MQNLKSESYSFIISVQSSHILKRVYNSVQTSYIFKKKRINAKLYLLLIL